ncbi:MAG: cytidylate kinase family protein [Desulfobacterales bacterium]
MSAWFLRVNFSARATIALKAVRCICSKDHRVKRLAKILKVPKSEAAKKLDEADKVQREFFRKVFKRNDASPYEFDLVINMDFIGKPKWAADIVKTAFRAKFKGEV